MASKIRVYELARELGLTNKETLDLCEALGIGVRSHSSSIVDAQADRVRRKADAEGLRREPRTEEPDEPAPAAPAPAARAPEQRATRSAPPEAPASPRPEPSTPPPAPLRPPPASQQPAAAGPARGPEAPAPRSPDRPGEPLHRLVTSGKASEQPDLEPPRQDRPASRPPPPPPPPRPPAPPSSRQGPAPAAGSAPHSPAPPRPGSTPAGRPPSPSTVRGPGGKPIEPPPGGPPRSGTGKPIPPPPGPRPTSQTGKAIPPPPGAGGRRASPPPSRGPSGPGRSGPSTGRPGGYGGGARPGGPPPLRPGQVPGAGGRPGGRPGGPRRPRRRGRRRRNREELQPQDIATYTPEDAPIPEGEVVIERGSTAKDLGPKLNRSAADVVRFLLQQGEMITATQTLSDDMIELFAADVGAVVRLVDPGQEQEVGLQQLLDVLDEEDEDEADLRPRPAVVTVMGHVDHGKTLLLDRIRSANVVAGEAGGITQHIGAYQVDKDGKRLTFIDTPGHEAFTSMRARGADATDIVILVVAADDGVMPTTLEALAHAKAAEVPIVVAINKVDRENADPNRVRQQLSEHGLVPEEWGGDTVMVEISALQNLGIDDLLENLAVVAELEDLRANPEGRSYGVVLEANLDIGRGPVATVLVQRGLLKVGDPMVAGPAWGRVRALIDDRGDQVKEAGPGVPVQVLGLSDVAEAGDDFVVAPDDRTARRVGETRGQYARIKSIASDASAISTGVKLEDIFEQIQKGEAATLNLVLKADVNGSLEALTDALRKLERDEVKIVFVHRAVGGITENDVQLASATGATIIGFNVRPDRKSRELAATEDVEIRTYDIIYQVLEDIGNALVGMLAPEYEEIVTGEAEVREVFRVPRVGAVAGCYVRSGTITRNSGVRFLREGTVIWKGTVQSLRRFKEDVREVAAGFECGVGLSDFQDLKPGDVIETFTQREIPRS
ncbi:MAG: translation initiation factor IF-2 [Actinobacteria bacterium]|nr:translation initiation factor IF-2 [Actinomycetota bacterium]